MVRSYLWFKEIGFEFGGYKKIKCLIWEWDQWQQCGFGSVFNGNAMGLGRWSMAAWVWVSGFGVVYDGG